MQRADAWNVDVSVERYLERCELKTAVLFEAACELGAVAGRVAPAANHGGRSARSAGSASRSGSPSRSSTTCSTSPGPPERTGKPRGTDLLDGTVTLPLILARERDPELAQLDLRARADAAQAAAVCDRIAATGVLAEAQVTRSALVERAKDRLPALPQRQRSALQLVADGVVERYV